MVKQLFLLLLFPVSLLWAGDLYPANDLKSVLKTARSYLGTPYRYGGNDRSGIDCSGLVKKSFARVDPGIPRSSGSIAAYSRGKNLSGLKQLRPGDLVFFSTRSRKIDHVGMVSAIKKGEIFFIHATSRGVIEERLAQHWRRDFVRGKQLFKRQGQARNVVRRKAVADKLPGRYPQASQQRLTRSELNRLNPYQLQLMRNEIFARYGYQFSNDKWRAYFDNRPWYRQIRRKSDNGKKIYQTRLSELERRNLQLIREAELKLARRG